MEDPHYKNLIKNTINEISKSGRFSNTAVKRKLIANVVKDADIVFSQTIGSRRE